MFGVGVEAAQTGGVAGDAHPVDQGGTSETGKAGGGRGVRTNLAKAGWLARLADGSKETVVVNLISALASVGNGGVVEDREMETRAANLTLVGVLGVALVAAGVTTDGVSVSAVDGDDDAARAQREVAKSG